MAGLVVAAALSAAACAPSEPWPPASGLRDDRERPDGGERVPGSERVDHGERPELIVLIVVDQLPQYLFARYEALFSGGFRGFLR